MAKNFGKSAMSKTFTEVAKQSNEKAQVITLVMISNDNLIDYPKNQENIEDTIDLENSMKQIGFTDPIEVTRYGVEEGKYMIVSGHRRRAAGVKTGMEVFPCIVRVFSDDNELKNYVLLSNSQRDSSKDPLLYCSRYKLHEQYLEDIKFKGSYREEIARRLGISVQHADRYKSFSKIILPVWDMVRNDVVGMSSMLPMATHPVYEQSEIYIIFEEYLSHGNTSITRETVKKIIDSYREGKRSYSAIFEEKQSIEDSGLPLNAFINDNANEKIEKQKTDLNKEHDYIADELDKMDEDREEWEKNRLDEINQQSKDNKTDNKREVDKISKDIIKCLDKLNTCFSNKYTFDDKKEATETLKNLASTFQIVVDEMHEIAHSYELTEEFKELLEDMGEKVKEY